MRSHCAAFGRVVAGFCVGLLASCGGGYGGGGSPPAASLTISISPTTITLGQSATVTWNSNAGTSCRASGAWSGTRAASGSESVTPTQVGTFTYTLTCSGGGYGDSDSESATLTVNPTSGFTLTLLVSKFAGSAALTTDPRLVNPRGIAIAPSAPVWVANSKTWAAYDGNGKAQRVSDAGIPNLSASTAGVAFEAIGVVVNDTTDFVITAGGKSDAAEFMFAGQGGIIGGWSRAVDPVNAVTMYVDTGSAVYKGLAVARNGDGNFLYVTDFHNNKIDVFNASLTKQTSSALSFAFSDPTLPAGYAPFGIQAIKNGPARATQLYVTYARQMQPDARDSAIGGGLGLVNVFDTNGKLLKHLVPTGRALNAPWGVALAPADFGTLSNTLLVGNFGDGKLNAYYPASGVFVGTVSEAGGRPIIVPGLWGIAFGNDSNHQPHNTLFFAAGINEVDGAYGRIDLDASPPTLNAP